MASNKMWNHLEVRCFVECPLCAGIPEKIDMVADRAAAGVVPEEVYERFSIACRELCSGCGFCKWKEEEEKLAEWRRKREQEYEYACPCGEH